MQPFPLPAWPPQALGGMHGQRRSRGRIHDTRDLPRTVDAAEDRPTAGPVLARVVPAARHSFVGLDAGAPIRPHRRWSGRAVPLIVTRLWRRLRHAAAPGRGGAEARALRILARHVRGRWARPLRRRKAIGTPRTRIHVRWRGYGLRRQAHRGGRRSRPRWLRTGPLPRRSCAASHEEHHQPEPAPSAHRSIMPRRTQRSSSHSAVVDWDRRHDPWAPMFREHAGFSLRMVAPAWLR
jgi:hypothetical protein